MEIMQGKNSRSIDTAEFTLRAAGYEEVLLDIGTGDGRFVLEAARRNSGLLAIGVDACRENLRDAARVGLTRNNVLFVIASASDLPAELHGLASRVTINFPWGSLRDGLLDGERRLLEGLRASMRPSARLEVRLNASALAEAGWDLLPGGERVRDWLAWAGFNPRPARLLDASALRALPSTWAKRLAFSRRPEAIALESRR